MSDREKSCKERWLKEKDSEIATLRELFEAYQSGTDEDGFHEHGLSFDYVAPGTFEDQREGYWRYQISWGGSSDEFRFYSSGPNYPPYRIEYAFLDWFDGHTEPLSGDDLALLLDIWEWFDDVGSVEHAYQEASDE